MPKIGDKVKKIRLRKGISLTELAERSGIAKSYLSSMERHIQTNPSIDLVQKIAGTLDVPVEVLILDEHDSSDEMLDPEWTKLAKEAMNSGISKQQLRDYIEFTKWQKRQER